MERSQLVLCRVSPHEVIDRLKAEEAQRGENRLGNATAALAMVEEGVGGGELASECGEDR